MNRTMLLASTLILLLAAPMSHAWEPLQVISLDLGGCWIHNQSSVWSLASFSDRVAITTGVFDFERVLNPLISTELQTAFSSFPSSATETYFHCSAGGHFFLTSIPDGPVPLCVWSKVQRDTGQLSLQGVYPDHLYRPGSECSGAIRKRLLISINPGSDIQSVMTYFRTSKRYSGVIVEVSPIGSSTIYARLDDSYDFREDVVKALVESDKLLADDRRAVEYDGLAYIVGEEYRLFAGSYPGY